MKMPILAEEPQIYPDGLFEPKLGGYSRHSWKVLHTRPRQEKSIARQLIAAGVPFYLPMIAKRSLIGKRVFTSQLPLFPSYLFHLAEHEGHFAAPGSNRIVRSIPVVDQSGLWRDLAQIRHLINSGVPITREDRLAPGELVEIKSGPLMGLRGKILSRASPKRLVVEVDFIHKGASILLDDFTLSCVVD